MDPKNPEKNKNDTHKSEIGTKNVPLKVVRPHLPTYGSYLSPSRHV